MHLLEAKLLKVILLQLNLLLLILMENNLSLHLMINLSNYGLLMILNSYKHFQDIRIGSKARNFHLIQEWLLLEVMIALWEYGMYLMDNRSKCILIILAWLIRLSFIQIVHVLHLVQQMEKLRFLTADQTDFYSIMMLMNKKILLTQSLLIKQEPI